ncbi:VIT1/CCC1 transporter family protein [Haloprofundus halophilus]|uniref:VIT1/CCC1 transporter family protein n=1 Tax=Haloprofundus halophilus TaxID=2283527 RepID=UPI000E44CFCD|nr:VIT1/CCC1 transporter family protein [Haloprofundus halophilus]
MTSYRELLRRDEVRSISRRYFISNGFDGTLTSIGIGVGAYLSGVPDGLTVFKIGLGAAVGLGTSGVWSVWEIERAEKRAEIARIERAMLTNLQETDVQQRQESARKINAAASGVGPLIGIVLPLLPFLAVGASLSLFLATVASVLVGVLVLFVFGAYLGTISKQNWVVAGIRMGAAGLVVAFLNLFLPG